MSLWRNGIRKLAVGCTVLVISTSSGIAADDAGSAGADAQASRRPAQVVRERYPDKSIKLERHVSQDEAFNFVNHGRWTMWDPAGNLVARGDYINGKRNGEWIRWFSATSEAAGDGESAAAKEGENADPLSGTEFEGFKPPIASKATFVEDRIHGAWTVSDADGRSLFSIELAKEIPVGKAIWWTASGQKRREIDFKNGIVDGRWQEWNAEGVLTRDDRYIQGCRLAEVTLTNDDGVKTADGVYLYAKENVKIDLDWWSGMMAVNATVTEGKPLKQGKWLYYHEDGSKRYEAEFVDDKPIGNHVWWFANGQVECEGRYEDGRQVGQWLYWHPNGVQAAQGEYANGQKVGRWLRWNPEGKVVENKSHMSRYPISSHETGRPAVNVPANSAARPQPGVRMLRNTRATPIAPKGVSG